MISKEQFEELKKFELNRPYPLFTNVTDGKHYGIIERNESIILNRIAAEKNIPKMDTCPACVLQRKRFLRQMADLYFEYIEYQNREYGPLKKKKGRQKQTLT